MNYKILRFSTSPYLLPNISEILKKIKDLSFEDTKEFFFSNLYFEMSDSFSKSMHNIGNISNDFISDFEILQKKWAYEKNINFDYQNWKVDIVLKQILYYKPDIIFFQDYYSLPIKIRKELKQIFPFIKLIVMHKGYPSSTFQFNDIDHIFAASVDFFKKLKKNNYPTSLSYHYFDEAILKKISNKNKVYDTTFIGTTGFNYPSHTKRFLILSNLLRDTKIHIWANEHKVKNINLRKSKELLKKVLFYILKLKNSKVSELILNNINNETRLYKFVEEIYFNLDNLENKKLDKLFFEKKYNISCDYNNSLQNNNNAFFHKPVFGKDYFQTLADSKITLNFHANQSYPFLNAKRLFEATGVGTLLVTDNGNNIKDLFIADEEIITFNKYDELKEKIKYLQNNPEEINKISKAGQNKTILKHNVHIRVKEIDTKIKELL